MFLPSMTDDSGPRFSWEGVKLSVAITATDKRLSQQACFHSSEQLASGLCLDNVAPCAEAKGFLHHLSRRFLSQEDDFRFREKFANLSSGFDSVQTWESDVQQNQIRLQFLDLPQRLPRRQSRVPERLTRRAIGSSSTINVLIGVRSICNSFTAAGRWR